MYTTNGVNPLPGLRNDFVERAEVNGMIHIRPVSPKPDQLALFHKHATDAGFRPGPETTWSNEKFPKYYYRPLDAQSQRDWDAIAWFQAEAEKRSYMGQLERLATVEYRIEHDIYTVHLDLSPNWCMILFRNGLEIESVVLP